jgi:hypothetical protein
MFLFRLNYFTENVPTYRIGQLHVGTSYSDVSYGVFFYLLWKQIQGKNKQDSRPFKNCKNQNSFHFMKSYI